MCDTYSTSQTRQVTSQVLHSCRDLVVPNWTVWLKKLLKKKKIESYGDAEDSTEEVEGLQEWNFLDGFTTSRVS